MGCEDTCVRERRCTSKECKNVVRNGTCNSYKDKCQKSCGFCKDDDVVPPSSTPPPRTMYQGDARRDACVNVRCSRPSFNPLKCQAGESLVENTDGGCCAPSHRCVTTTGPTYLTDEDDESKETEVAKVKEVQEQSSSDTDSNGIPNLYILEAALF